MLPGRSMLPSGSCIDPIGDSTLDCVSGDDRGSRFCRCTEEMAIRKTPYCGVELLSRSQSPDAALVPALVSPGKG